MNKAQLKKSLRKARLQVSIREKELEGVFVSPTLGATLKLTLEDSHGWRSSFSFRSYAYEITESRPAPQEVWRRFEGYAGFDDPRCSVDIHFPGPNEDGSLLMTLAEMVRETQHAFNLDYRYRECGLSRFVTTLEKLGVSVEFEGIDGLQLLEWHQAKRAKETA